MGKKSVAQKTQPVQETEQTEKLVTKPKKSPAKKKVVIDEAQIEEQVKAAKEAINEKPTKKKESFLQKLVKLKVRLLYWFTK